MYYTLYVFCVYFVFTFFVSLLFSAPIRAFFLFHDFWFHFHLAFCSFYGCTASARVCFFCFLRVVAFKQAGVPGYFFDIQPVTCLVLTFCSSSSSGSNILVAVDACVFIWQLPLFVERMPTAGCEACGFLIYSSFLLYKRVFELVVF